MMTATWFGVGLAAASCARLLFRLWHFHRPGVLRLGALATGMFLILFCAAWSVGAMLEGVPRAASMGVVLFGLPGIALVTVAGRAVVSRGAGS
jgi:hypothetical protein